MKRITPEVIAMVIVILLASYIVFGEPGVKIANYLCTKSVLIGALDERVCIITNGSAWGTGFPVGNYVYTAGHVMEAMQGSDEIYIVTPKRTITLRGWETLTFKDRDVAAVRVKLNYSHKVSFTPVAIGDKVQVLTMLSPQGKQLYFGEGRVTDLFGNIILTNMFCRQGFSGSPALNSDNEVVGIVVMIDGVGYSGEESDFRPTYYERFTRDLIKE